MAATENLSESVGVAPACFSMGVARSTLYYNRQPKQEPKPRPKSARALTDGERQAVLDELHNDRFVDKSPEGTGQVDVFLPLCDSGYLQ